MTRHYELRRDYVKSTLFGRHVVVPWARKVAAWIWRILFCFTGAQDPGSRFPR